MGILNLQSGIRPVLLWIISMAVAGFACAAQAQGSNAMNLTEQKIKAGLVYNFLKYTTWSENSFVKSGNNFEVCLFGGDPFEGHLDPLAGRTAQQHVIVIREIEKLEETGNCHLVFVHQSQENNISNVLNYLNNRNILTVSDISRFSRKGGMVELSMQEDQHIHLYINKNKVDNAGLDIQNRILKLAELVP